MLSQVTGMVVGQERTYCGRLGIPLRALALATVSYAGYGAGVIVSTWSIAAQDASFSTVLSALLFLVAPCVVAAPTIGVLLDRELTKRWLSIATVLGAIALGPAR